MLPEAVNAAINLRNAAVSSTVTVCGEESAGFVQKDRVKLTSRDTVLTVKEAGSKRQIKSEHI
jgi:hypothetical protein